MTFGTTYQLPVLPPKTYDQPASWQLGTTLRDWILPRVLELAYTAYDLEPFARDCGYEGKPFTWDEARRFLLRCELDACYFHLYGISRDDLDYIMNTFPIVRRRDEAHYGEYRTKRVISEIYDAMQRAIESGEAYQTLLDPPPANGWEPPEMPVAAHVEHDGGERSPSVEHSPKDGTTDAPGRNGSANGSNAQSVQPVTPMATPTQTAERQGSAPSPKLSTPAPEAVRPQQVSLFDFAPPQPATTPTFKVGDRVRHAYFGEGQVRAVQPSGKDVAVTVAFKDAGVKKLMASIARLEKL